LDYVSQFKDDVLNPDGTVDKPGNKMDVENLCTCVAPNLLYSKSKNPVDDESFLSNAVLSMLMKYQSDIWKVLLFILLTIDSGCYSRTITETIGGV
jgi:hypothetical protein